MNGFQWLFTNGKDTLSVIFHDCSYGHEYGLFEILPSWTCPHCNKICSGKHDSVKGHLTFAEVGRWINKLSKVSEATTK